MILIVGMLLFGLQNTIRKSNYGSNITVIYFNQYPTIIPKIPIAHFTSSSSPGFRKITAMQNNPNTAVTPI